MRESLVKLRNPGHGGVGRTARYTRPGPEGVGQGPTCGYLARHSRWMRNISRVEITFGFQPGPFELRLQWGHTSDRCRLAAPA
jgi:hypothetical protein